MSKEKRETVREKNKKREREKERQPNFVKFNL